MEFLPYAETLRTLEHQGIVPHGSGSLVRFSLRPASGRNVQPPYRIAIGPKEATGAIEDANERLDVPVDGLAEKLEQVVARSHAGEWVLIPAGLWRSVLDLAAFDLARDEAWLDVDAEASLHQNKRDPLGMLPRSRHILRVFAGAIFGNGAAGDGACDLTVAAIDAPLLIEVLSRGVLVVTCAGEEIAHGLLGRR